MAALLLAACETSGVIGGAPADDVQPDPPLPPPPFVAAESALLRLTQQQYRNSVVDVFGEHVVVAGGLENDNRVDHSLQVGASFGGVSARGTEQYEAMAVTVADQVLEAGAERDALMPCTPAGDDGRHLRPRLPGRVWRAPVAPTAGGRRAHSAHDHLQHRSHHTERLLRRPRVRPGGPADFAQLPVPRGARRGEPCRGGERRRAGAALLQHGDGLAPQLLPVELGARRHPAGCGRGG
jgi:hypothetical protein